MLAIIPAREGSKRVVGKNIRPLGGIPLIAHTIKAAIKSKKIDRVIVSTDDNQIAEIAKDYGAEIPFIRPKELSNDYVETIPVIKHAIVWFEGNNISIKYVCCLYATAPFIQSQILSKAYQQLKDSKANYCFSVTSFPFPIQRAIKIIHQNRLNMFFPEYFHARSQDLEEAYHDAGQFYWGNSQAFKDELPFFSESATPYLLPRFLVQDIDSSEDWVRAEAMYQVLQKTKILS